MRIAVISLRTCPWRVYLYDDVIIVFAFSNIIIVVSCRQLSVNAVDKQLEAQPTTIMAGSTGSRSTRAASRLVAEATARAALARVTQEVATHFRFRVDRRHLGELGHLTSHRTDIHAAPSTMSRCRTSFVSSMKMGASGH